MRQAISAAPGVIAEPIDVAVLRKSKKGYEASTLDENQLEQHRNRALEANERLRDALLEHSEPQSAPEAMPQPTGV